MAAKKLDESVSAIPTTATPDTISYLAAHTELSPMDEKTALSIKLCEEKINNKLNEKYSKLNEKNIELKEKYRAILHELRDRIQTIKFDDFLKIIIGILGGFVVRAFNQQGIEAIKEIWVGSSILIFVFVLFFLIIRYLGPSTRKKEIENELKRLDDRIM